MLHLNSLEELLTRALGTLEPQRDTCVVKNPKIDTFDLLLAESGCIDASNCLGLWKMEDFETTGGYSEYTGYIYSTIGPGVFNRKVRALSTKEVMGHFECPMFTEEATTREILAFYIFNRIMFDKLLRKGHRIVGLGRDSFTVFSGVAVISVISGEKALTIESLPLGKWTRKDIFISRAP